MSNPAQPDPATRAEAEIAADVLSAHAQYLRDLAAAEENPFVVLGLQDAARRADKAASGYAKTVPPPLPDEPPDGTVLAGKGTDVWRRADALADIRDNLEGPRWHRVGDPVDWEWAEAYAKGADPGRRLVELPDDECIEYLADLLNVGIRATHSECITAVRAILRSLAERGQQ